MTFLLNRNHTRNVPWVWMIRKWTGAWAIADGQSSLLGLADPLLWASGRGCLFLPSSCKRAGAFLLYLELAALDGQVLDSADRSYGSVVGTFPSANESDRNWFVKLNLCRKVDLCEREGFGSLVSIPSVLGKFVAGRRSRESLSDTPRIIFFFCCCPVIKQGKILDLVAAPSMGMQLFVLVSWICSFPLACSPL